MTNKETLVLTEEEVKELKEWKEEIIRKMIDTWRISEEDEKLFSEGERMSLGLLQEHIRLKSLTEVQLVKENIIKEAKRNKRIKEKRERNRKNRK